MKPVLPLLWRIEAKSGDGKTVTLGKYATEAEAENDRERYTLPSISTKLRTVEELVKVITSGRCLGSPNAASHSLRDDSGTAVS